MSEAFNLESVPHLHQNEPESLVFDFYAIALKRMFNAKVKYGQQAYDFDEDVMFFTSPGQIFSVKSHGDEKFKQSGWALFVHPDFLWNTPLARGIKKYEYFDYRVNEALHLSEKEETTITNIMQNIEQEYRSNIDKFSQGVMVSQIELLLNYANRFYNRQFITRQKASNDLLSKLENLLTEYFNTQNDFQSGLPTVKFLSRIIGGRVRGSLFGAQPGAGQRFGCDGLRDCSRRHFGLRIHAACV